MDPNHFIFPGRALPSDDYANACLSDTLVPDAQGQRKLISLLEWSRAGESDASSPHSRILPAITVYLRSITLIVTSGILIGSRLEDPASSQDNIVN